VVLLLTSSVRGNHAGNSSSSSSTSVLSPDDTTFDYDDTSLFCQQIGVPMESIPFLQFDKLIEEVRRPLFALTAGTSSTAEANEQLWYYLVQKFSETRIGDPNDNHNFSYLYQLHSLSRGGVITVCRTTYIIITELKNTLREVFTRFGMNYNLYEQNMNQFIDTTKISESMTALICVTFLAEWLELAGEQEVSYALNKII
jgi:hypothetical protein